MPGWKDAAVHMIGGTDMPRRDGTGPEGFGPLTGRQMGWCAGYLYPPSWQMRGPGMRMRRRRFRDPGYFYQREAGDEQQVLEEECRLLENELKTVKERLDALVKSQKE